MSREIDSLIAAHVFGFNLVRFGLSGEYDDPLNYYKAPQGTCEPNCLDHEHIVPNYFTSISDAWMVVEKMQNDRRLFLNQNIESGLWMA